MSIKETIKKGIADYFESTTIHGFSYLKASRTLLERLAWIMIIGTCFSLAIILIQQSIYEANRNPFITNFETMPIQSIPFPAITVDSGPPDPWGYAEKILNGLAFDSFEGDTLPEATELRKLSSIMLDELILVMNSSILHGFPARAAKIPGLKLFPGKNSQEFPGMPKLLQKCTKN